MFPRLTNDQTNNHKLSTETWQFTNLGWKIDKRHYPEMTSQREGLTRNFVAFVSRMSHRRFLRGFSFARETAVQLPRYLPSLWLCFLLEAESQSFASVFRVLCVCPKQIEETFTWQLRAPPCQSRDSSLSRGLLFSDVAGQLRAETSRSPRFVP